MRRWYLRRAVPWVAVLTCCALAVAGTAAVHRWPTSAWALLPLVLASCAAACGFVFDDLATAVTTITPRGAGWRRTSRLGAALLPFGLWVAVVASAPDSLALDAAGWWLVGAGVAALSAGVAAVGARRQLPRPGPQVAGVVVLLVLAPLVMGNFLGWDPIYPFGDFPGWVAGMWAGLLGLGVLLVGWSLRPGLRP